MTTETHTGSVRYSRWHTARSITANLLEAVGAIADTGCCLVALYGAFVAASSAVGESPNYPTADAPGLVVLTLAALGAGRAAHWLFQQPARWLRPELGDLPGGSVPAHIRHRVHTELVGRGESRPDHLAAVLQLPEQTVVCALRRLTRDGLAGKTGWRLWTPVASGALDEESGPQVPTTRGGGR